MTGTDSLIVLDEAHIAEPFVQTARGIREHQARAPEKTGRALVVVPISATLPPLTPGKLFRLNDEELEEEGLRRRLAARKRMRLVTTTNRVKGLVSEATRLAHEGAVVVGVVANTVKEARAVHAALAARHSALLIIGPSRPLERDSILERIAPRADRSAEEPLFVIATQTIEVGLDLDFDALVSAAAPFQSLAQRLGRLDRAGVLGESAGAIVHSRQPDHVYGEASAATFAWLLERSIDDNLDLGPNELRTLAEQGPPAAPDPPRAPILSPHHVEALAQSSLEPRPSPEIGFFLHGEDGARDADVGVCWRADLREGAPDTDWMERCAARPPHQRELISLPVGVVRAWLAQLAEPEFGDIESMALAIPPSEQSGLRYVRVPPSDPDGRLDPRVSRLPADIRPGDVVVAPAARGGATEFGWDPGSRTPVSDLGNLAIRQPRILVDPDLPGPVGGPESEPVAAVARDLLAEIRAETLIDDPYPRLRDVLVEWAAADREPGAIAEARRQLQGELAESGTVIPVPSDDPMALILKPAPGRGAQRRSPAISLSAHTERVEELAGKFAGAVDLDEQVIRSIELAARYHDAGKLDPRFQAWLNDGQPVRGDEPLAKSATGTGTIRWRAAARAAGWPARKRHENLSALLLSRVLADGIGSDVDRELAVHLVATHHGLGRPFFSQEEPDRDPVDIDFSALGHAAILRSDEEIPWSERVHRYCELSARFGEWGLASLEAILVSADRLASAEAGE